MTNPNRVRGDNFERAVVAFMNANGFPRAERAYGAGRPDDRGDLDGLPGLTVQLKDEARNDFSGYLREAEEQRSRAGDLFGIAIVKRRRRPIADSYVVMTLDTFCRMSGYLAGGRTQ